MTSNAATKAATPAAYGGQVPDVTGAEADKKVETEISRFTLGSAGTVPAHKPFSG